MTQFLPSDYEKPQSAWWKYLKLQKWETRLRIISSPIMWWVDRDKSWSTPKAIRTIEKQEPLWESKPKHFRALTVLHDNEVKIWEITQASIQDSLISYAKDTDWWDPRNYDIMITRTWESMETKYSVIAKPKTELSEAQKLLIASTEVNIIALYEWKDPFE